MVRIFARETASTRRQGRAAPLFRTLLLLAVLVLAVLALFPALPFQAAAQTTLPGLGAYGEAAGEGPEASGDGVGGAVPSDGDSLDAYSGLESALQMDQDKLVKMTQSSLEGFVQAVKQKIADAPAARIEVWNALAEKSPTGDPFYFALITALTVVNLIAATLAVILIYGVVMVRRWFIRQKRANPQGLSEKLPILLLRGVLGVIGVALAVAVALVLGYIYGGSIEEPEVQETLIIIFAAYVAIRLITLTWRVVLAPYLPEYRLPHFSDRDARKLFHWLWVTAALAIAFQAYCVWMEALGLSQTAHAIDTSLLTFGIVLINVAMVLANHRAVSTAIRNGRAPEDVTWPARLASRYWGLAVVAYGVVAWSVMTYRMVLDLPPGPPLIVSAYIIVVSALAVYGLTAYALQRLFTLRRTLPEPSEPAPVQPEAFSPTASRTVDAAASVGLGADDDVDADEGGGAQPVASRAASIPPPPRKGRMNSFDALGRRIASIFAVVAGLWALAETWSVEGPERLSAWTERLDDMAAVILIGYIAFHAFRIWIDKRIEEEGVYDAPGLPLEGEGGGAGASRLATLLPLFRNFLLTTITISVLLILALEVGVNVTPLFAGAGVIGLALGFGAQALVRDILSGAFFLVDDAFRKGEYIDLGHVKGIVERISVRSFQLRHHLGYLHTVPFGEIQYMTNYSRDWVIMKLPIRLTYDTDAEHVRKMVKKLGQELLEDPEHGHKFLQPLKSQGVIQMEDSAMIMRVKFMTRPGEQWVLRKVIFAKIRELFQREGIPFAHREVTVRIADGPERPLTEAEKAEAAGAAARLIQNDGPQENTAALAESR